MKAEKIILSFVAVLIGLLVAGAAFYLYQSTKVISPTSEKSLAVKTPTLSPTPAPDSSILSLDTPKDESVVTTKTITISGKAAIDATIVVNTPVDDQVATPSSTGDFTTTATIDNGENEINVTAIQPNGNEVTKKVTVTYSTENF